MVSRGEAPVEDLRPEQFGDIVYRFRLQKRSKNDENMKISHNSPPDS